MQRGNYLYFLCMPKSFDGDMPQRKMLSHGIPEWVDRDDHWFITICCQPRGLNQSANSRSFGAIVESPRFREAEGDLKVAIANRLPLPPRGSASLGRVGTASRQSRIHDRLFRDQPDDPTPEGTFQRRDHDADREPIGRTS